MNAPVNHLTERALHLLRQLIATPSVSRDEAAAAAVMRRAMDDAGLAYETEGCNTWCVSPHFAPDRPTLLLNAHIDTVRPAAGWQRDPFSPIEEDGRLYGLGSNDCGGGLVSLFEVFRYFVHEAPADACAYNLVYAATAEEEVSGRGGMECVLPRLPHIDVALVGEPTGMQPAVAEKGLMVVDAVAEGRAGHAARGEGENALYKALDDIDRLRRHRFSRVSPLLGEVRMTVTIIEAGTQHNVVPAECRFTVDVRSNELYTNEELFDEMQRLVGARLKARSFRLGSSSISPDHPLVRRAVALGRTPYGSPTLSDQALMRFASLKMGPGMSERSHTADEYIGLREVEEGIGLYLQLLKA